MNISKRISDLAYRLLRPVDAVRLISDPTNSLTRLANKYGSDKGDVKLSRHCYTRVYGKLFEPVKHDRLNFVEIGLLHFKDKGWANSSTRDEGGQSAKHAPSLEMWSTYFRNGSVFGFDINDFSAVSLDRVQIIQGDMGVPNDLLSLCEIVGKEIDIVIDDASHASHHQQIALASIIRHVRPGGLYIIEDLHYQPAPLEEANATKTRDLLRRGSVNGDYRSAHIDESASNYLSSWVESIEFFDSLSLDAALSNNDALAVIRKRRSERA